MVLNIPKMTFEEMKQTVGKVLKHPRHGRVFI